jgi:hypothetical protein
MRGLIARYRTPEVALLAGALILMQLLDLGTRALLPSASEFNPLAKDLAVFVPLKIGGVAFSLWANGRLLELNRMAGLSGLLIGALLGALGAGSNLAVLLGMWLS